MTQIALIAAFELDPADMAAFLAAARREREAVRDNEPGCLRFDVILFDDTDGAGAFVEVFSDRAAAEKHRETPHFRAFFDAIEPLDVRWTVRRGTALG